MKDKIKNSELLKKHKSKIIFCLGCGVAYLLGKRAGKNEGIDIGTYAIEAALSKMPEESCQEFKKCLSEVVNDVTE